MSDDEIAALDFDLACTDRLAEYDNEKEQRLIEAVSAGAVMNTLSNVIPHK